METLVVKPTARSVRPDNRRRVFAHGASSAFDISGLKTFQDTAFRLRRLKRLDPAGTISTDMLRVMDRFGRSAACAREAVDAGIALDDLEVGCTDRNDVPDSNGFPLRNTGSSGGAKLEKA